MYIDIDFAKFSSNLFNQNTLQLMKFVEMTLNLNFMTT